MKKLKHYSVVNVNGRGMVVCDGRALIDNLYLHANLSRQWSHDCFLREIRENGDALILDFGNDFQTLTIELKEYDYVLQCTLHAKLRGFCNGFSGYFTSDRGLVLHYHFAQTIDGLLSSDLRDRFWHSHRFEKEIETLPAVTQSVLIASGDQHFHLLPLTCESFRSEINGSAIELSSGCAAGKEMTGTFLTMSLNKNPYQAIAENFIKSRQSGGIRVPLKKERRYPETFESIGWCSWNAFYTNLTSEGVYQKLEEFQKKGIPVKWILLDDGWQQYQNSLLTSFREDPKKFPEGLYAFVSRVKEQYGIEKVGVWHAFAGHWDGIQPGSELAEQQKKNLITTPGGLLVVAPTYEQQFAFFDTWHSYLQEQGIDFVKVDGQSGVSTYYNELLPSPMAAAAAHQALDASVEKHFGGCMINCMGMNMENVLNRPSSSVNRNSYDYDPRHTDGFYVHLWDNIYSALFHDQMQYCDYDMWWSAHENACMSAVLRGISGGPVYVSDEVDRSESAYITPLINENGRIYRCDHAAYPTRDCLYKDVIHENTVIKIFNRSGENFVAAAFCQCHDDVTGVLHIDDIPEMEGTYAAQDYFTKSWFLFDREHPLTFQVKFNETRLWNFYPVSDGRVQVGREDKYMGCASPKRECILAELLN